MTRPQLYPNHQHQWVSVTCGGVHEFGEDCNHESTLVRCTVCGFEAPRTLANLDGLADPEPRGGPRAKVWWLPQLENGIAFTAAEVDAALTADAGGSDTDTRCTHQDAAGQCLDHQGHAGDHQYPQPEQETRA